MEGCVGLSVRSAPSARKARAPRPISAPEAVLNASPPPPPPLPAPSRPGRPPVRPPRGLPRPGGSRLAFTSFGHRSVRGLSIPVGFPWVSRGLGGREGSLTAVRRPGGPRSRAALRLGQGDGVVFRGDSAQGTHAQGTPGPGPEGAAQGLLGPQSLTTSLASLEVAQTPHTQSRAPREQMGKQQPRSLSLRGQVSRERKGCGSL